MTDEQERNAYTKKVRAGEVLRIGPDLEISWTGKRGIGQRVELRIVKPKAIQVSRERVPP